MPFLKQPLSTHAATWVFFPPHFGATTSPVATSLSCCAERERRQRRPSFFSSLHAATDAGVRILYNTPSFVPACTSIVGGRVGIPLNTDEVAARRKMFRSRLRETLPMIHEDTFVCEDCHACTYRPDVVLGITNVQKVKPSQFRLEDPPSRALSVLPARKGKLPMQLNQKGRPSKNAFANFPTRQSPRV
ncbi:hypothetical protein H310_08523 [Aphanomyces invadans]|uniref:Uncharacterized protein n=1 Tax=Aphanomyces invadans TaxID=157072 RepID=A0A024TZM4_9STRA|nr:hypothetical protein H310_08523 [Aphanomyces invadans]ETV99106.1 hypothetical protein H310_08523 [Aphanomyces invadans]|eukprot:XP_008872534.1 hypothetical protein H310_08523 [Aphanomyces invadans]